MKKFSLNQSIIFVISTTAILTLVNSCNGKKSVMIYGTKWTGLIRTPLVPPYQAPGNPPYTIKEDMKVSGGMGEMQGDLSKYNFSIESSSLRIINDKPGSSETWKDVWYSYFDSGIQSDGSREAFIKGRCFLKNKKLNTLHPAGALPFDLRLVVVPNKPYHFVMNVKTTQKGTASDLQVSGNADDPNGVITFFPTK